MAPTELLAEQLAAWTGRAIAVVADDASGLLMVDVSDPALPAILAATPGAIVASGVLLAGDQAYVIDGGSTLQVVDITDPTNPALAGSCPLGTASGGLALAGNVLYVAGLAGGLLAVDVSDPQAPKKTTANGHSPLMCRATRSATSEWV